jgi:hypothetical protein
LLSLKQLTFFISFRNFIPFIAGILKSEIT